MTRTRTRGAARPLGRAALASPRPGRKPRAKKSGALVARAVASPLGPIHVTASEHGVAGVQIGGAAPRVSAAPAATAEAGARAREHLVSAEIALGRFFAGQPAALEVVRLDLGALSAFQRQVYSALRSIAPGATLTYGALAARIGRPAAARAVGRAMARNPLPLLIPCHRVIGSDGGLHGYSVGGAGEHDLGVKRRLLDLERTAGLASSRPTGHNVQET